MRRLGAILMLGVTCGCAFPLTGAGYSAVLDTWIGHPIAEMMDRWGYPESSFVDGAGNTVYVYRRESTYTTPTHLQATRSPAGNRYRTEVYGGQTVLNQCTTWIVVDAERRIVSWKYNGNDCY